MSQVIRLPSYMCDTLDLLKQIEVVSVPPNALLMTIDVEALYSSISQERGIGVVKTFLKEQNQVQW